MVLDLPAADLNELSIENEGISPPETSEGYPDCIYIYIGECLGLFVCGGQKLFLK
jgi:hypothetical protein